MRRRIAERKAEAAGAAVEPGSVAERIGLKAGDEILELNGKPLLDVIDFQFQAAASGAGRRSERRTARSRLSAANGNRLGLEFEADRADDLRESVRVLFRPSESEKGSQIAAYQG